MTQHVSDCGLFIWDDEHETLTCSDTAPPLQPGTIYRLRWNGQPIVRNGDILFDTITVQLTPPNLQAPIRTTKPDDAPLSLKEVADKFWQRNKHYKNKAGRTVDCTQWPIDRWTNALAGEAGEVANNAKKLYRDDIPVAELRPAIAEECADVLLYLLAVIKSLDLPIEDFEQIIKAKFNKTSRATDNSILL